MTLRSLFVDFNSYFASVEQEDTPCLRGRPVAVTPVVAPTGCCIAASIEAKTSGMKTGCLVRDAKRLCPGIAIVEARPALYVAWHRRLMAAIERAILIDAVHSVDEAACELIGRQCRRDNAIAVARALKREVAAAAPGGAIRCSIGIAPNHWLAKTCTDIQKPDGLVVIEQQDLPHILHGMQLTDLCGTSTSMQARLHAAGIDSVAQLTAADRHVLRAAWGGIEGERMWAQLRGEWLPERHSTCGSVGHSHVLEPALRTPQGARAVLTKLLAKAAMRLRSYHLLAGALSLRIRYLGIEQRWEHDAVFDPTDDRRAFLQRMNEALDRAARRPGGCRSRVPNRCRSASPCIGCCHAPLHRMTCLATLTMARRYRYCWMASTRASATTRCTLAACTARAPPRPCAFRSRACRNSNRKKTTTWLTAMNQANVLAEAEHRERERERERAARIARLKQPVARPPQDRPAI